MALAELSMDASKIPQQPLSQQVLTRVRRLRIMSSCIILINGILVPVLAVRYYGFVFSVHMTCICLGISLTIWDYNNSLLEGRSLFARRRRLLDCFLAVLAVLAGIAVLFAS